MKKWAIIISSPTGEIKHEIINDTTLGAIAGARNILADSDNYALEIIQRGVMFKVSDSSTQVFIAALRD